MRNSVRTGYINSPEYIYVRMDDEVGSKSSDGALSDALLIQ